MLVGRDAELQLVNGLISGLPESGGKVVLIRGEAGIGKSSLVRELAGIHAHDADFLFGFCDNLLTPQPLAPFWDFAYEEPSLTAPLEEGDRHGVLAGCLELLSRSPRPTVLVIEDTHWADEATLDAVRYVGRRIARTNGLLLLTYRDGEVDLEHPLRLVMGELPPQNLARLHLERLTKSDVASMVGGSDLPVDDVLALTGGNPLFVTEVVASGMETVPTSVQDSVLARAAGLSTEARQLLDLVSVIPSESERSLIDGILGPEPEHLAECERRRLLEVGAHTLSFRHELSRRAIESALDASDRRRLNAHVFAELADSADPARLVHHAREADDLDSVFEHAPRAARAAMASNSWREAVAHFRTMEPHLDRLDVPDRASLLEDWALSEFYLDNVESADIMSRAVELRREEGDDLALAQALITGVRLYEISGRPEEASRCSAEAVAILEARSPSAELGLALGLRAWLGLMRSDDDDATLDLANRAIATAEATNGELAMIFGLYAKGAIEFGRGDLGAVSLVEESHRRAQRGGHRFEEALALVNLTGMAGDVRDLGRAVDLAQRTRDTAARYELRSVEFYAQAVYSELLMWLGDWDAATDTATEVLGSHAHSETTALRILGLLQARQGHSRARETLAQMWQLSEASGEHQHVDPAASVLLEHMWLTGERDTGLMERMRGVLDWGVRVGPPWPSGALVFWLWELGELEEIPEGVPDVYRLIIEGEPLAAAAMWERIGCPYERALALMHGDEAARLEALEILDDLGAAAVAAKLRQDLRDRGVRVTRGKGRKTRAHAGGLTARQAEVLELLAEGLSNSDIADRLFVSRRTVEHHVSAVLTKLDCSTREEAVSRARDHDLLGQRVETLARDR